MGCSVALFVYVFCQDNMALVDWLSLHFSVKTLGLYPPPLNLQKNTTNGHQTPIQDVEIVSISLKTRHI